MGRDVCSHAKSKCKYGSLLNDNRVFLTYPSIDNITQEVFRLGKGCKIFSRHQQSI